MSTRVPMYDGSIWSEIDDPWPWADDEDLPARMKRLGLEEAWAFGDEEGDCIRLLRAPDGRYLVTVAGYCLCDEVVAPHVGAAFDLAARWSAALRAKEDESLRALATVALRAFEVWHGHPLTPDDPASGCRDCNRTWEWERAERRRHREEAQRRLRNGGA